MIRFAKSLLAGVLALALIGGGEGRSQPSKQRDCCGKSCPCAPKAPCARPQPGCRIAPAGVVATDGPILELVVCILPSIVLPLPTASTGYVASVRDVDPPGRRSAGPSGRSPPDALLG